QFLPRLACRELALDGVVVVAAVLDRVVEDCRIGCEPGDREVIDIAAERASAQQVARDVVEPEALAEIVQDSSGLHATPLSRPRNCVSSFRSPSTASAKPPSSQESITAPGSLNLPDTGFTALNMCGQCAVDASNHSQDFARAGHALRPRWAWVSGSHARPSCASRRSAASGPALPAA